LRNAGGWERKSNRVRVSAVTCEHRFAALDRLQKVKRGNRAARSVSFLALARDYQRGSSVTLYHASGSDADHPSMPALTIHHDAERLAHLRGFIQASTNLINDAGLFRLTIAVQAIQALS